MPAHGYRYAHGWAHRLAICLTADEQQTLERWQRQGAPVLARRAQVILLRAQGLTYAEIRRRTGMTINYMFKWVRRYVREGGIRGLRPARGAPRRPGRPLRPPRARPRPRPLVGTRLAGLRRAIAKGMPLTDICRVYQVTRPQVAQARRQLLGDVG